jgi:hypothetical protein
MSPLRALAAIALLSLLGCGGGQPDMDTLCSDQPQALADGLVQQAGCAFEQQLDNILHHGTNASGALTAGASPTTALVARTCGRYLQATDAQGITVIVDTKSGNALSHGSVHPGFPKSAMPAKLPLPIAY